MVGAAVSVDATEGGTVERTPKVMPGVLIRSEDNLKIVKASKTAIGERQENMETSDPQRSQVQTLTNGVQLTNGDKGLPNGTHASGIPAELIDGQSKPMKGVENLLDGQLPPEIEHITYGYIPLSSLITRLAQETFNGLTDVINDMSEIGPSQSNVSSGFPGAQVNGNSAGDSSESNVQKKQRMLEFAQERRQQFVKALVLSQWSRQAEQVGKCIDLKVWLDAQRRTYNDAVGWVGELKRVVETTKMPNPDLHTALEALSLGKASWLPDVRLF